MYMQVQYNEILLEFLARGEAIFYNIGGEYQPVLSGITI